MGGQGGLSEFVDGTIRATRNPGCPLRPFGEANNSTLTLLWDLLLAADAQAVNGVLYNGNAARRDEANNVFSAATRPAASADVIATRHDRPPALTQARVLAEPKWAKWAPTPQVLTQQQLATITIGAPREKGGLS